MGFNFMPKDEDFYGYFKKASKIAVDAARTFKELVGSWSPDSKKIDEIHAIEKEGDLVRHELVDKLNRTFITPIDREDIYSLSGELDDIIDMIQACTDRMQIYCIGKINPDTIKLAEILEKSAIALEKAIGDMQDKKKTRRVMDHVIEVNQLENEGDTMLRKLLRDLFCGCKAEDALEIMKMKEMYEAIEAAIDKCEDCACSIESIVVKHS